MTASKHLIPLLLSIIGLLFFSSCAEDPPQKTTAKDSQPEPIIEGDTTWTDGKITRLSSSKRGNDVIEVELIQYSPNKDSSSATIKLNRSSSTANSKKKSYNSTHITAFYPIAIDSFQGLHSFDAESSLLKRYHIMHHSIDTKHQETTKTIALYGNRKNFKDFINFSSKVISKILEHELAHPLVTSSSDIQRRSFFDMNGNYLLSFKHDITINFGLDITDSLNAKKSLLPDFFIQSIYNE
ncbi:hypothetical protein PPO43_09485 [Saprospira sp. CCB-QB6]|uniref:hypothetical protein n=1 Tax=Saprospira sp. CCB-QB6 TaxID=3023936 RepID=UPI00234AA3AE|nr:hypothetical protein [Saprospira sp. CCB-QB6]WCL80207.1 hypothetical protein PPO43_09485 [Saprospira sp. CCB-QB6]